MSQMEMRTCIGNWRKDNPCYKMAKTNKNKQTKKHTSAEMCSSVLCKVKLVSNGIGY